MTRSPSPSFHGFEEEEVLAQLRTSSQMSHLIRSLETDTEEDTTVMDNEMVQVHLFI